MAEIKVGDYVTAALVCAGQNCGTTQGVVVGIGPDLLYLLHQDGQWCRARRNKATVVPLKNLWGSTGYFVRKVRDEVCPGRGGSDG